MTNDYRENLAKHRRLSILRLLAGSEDKGGAGAANESLIYDCLEDVGLDAGLTRDAVRDAIKWLAERDLVRISMADTLMVARVTQRGVDCARGRIIVEGVKKPSIGVP